MKPHEYSNQFVVMQDTAYTVVERDGSVTGIPRIAPLSVGRVVWLPADGELKRLEQNRVVAWAENIGTVSINRNAIAQP